MAGLVPAISFRGALCQPDRGHRDKPGDDKKNYAALTHSFIASTRATNSEIAFSVGSGASRCGE